MTNEVINENEESQQSETSVIEETNNQTPETVVPETETETVVPEEQAVLATSETGAEEDTHNGGEVDFGKILEKFEQEQTVYHSGELVTGKVISISDRGILVDFGYKSEGIVPIEEFTAENGEVTIKQGDEVEVVIRSIHTGDAPPALSHLDALRRKSWDEIEEAFREERPITGLVIDKTKGGLRIDINGVEAFLPGSQIDSRPIRSLDSYRGKEIEAKIIKCSRRRNNIVLSRKVLTDAVVNEQKAITLGNIEEGYVIEGTIKNLTEYGAFVDIGGIDGLLHVTDMSWNKQQNPAALFKAGENVQVKVLKLDREKEKVSLGYKQLIPNPWATAAEIYPVGSKVTGRISTVTEYGAFIELEPNIEGLVHISEMSWSKRTRSPKKFLNQGEEVEVQVLGIDSDDHRISLGMKQLMPNPWETVRERYHVGDRIHGKIRNITDFGAFVEIEDGVDGLVHVTDISWSKKIKHPKDLLSRDQEVDAIITGIDVPGRRMSLSIKDITPSAWESFVATHKTGDVVRGKVTRIAEFGVFVELGDELEGLCHISELSDERINRADEVVKVGQELDFRVLRIEYETRKIGLSARSTGSGESASGDSRSYTSEAKGGMASLGELANLKFGRGTEVPVEEEKPKLSKKERKALKAIERAAAEAAAERGETAEETAEETEVETSAEVSDEATSETEPTESAEEKTEVPAETPEVTEEKTETPAETVEAAEEVAETVEETAEVAEVTTETAETTAETTAEIAEVATETTEVVETPAETIETEKAETADETVVENATDETPSLTDTENEAKVASEETTPAEETEKAETTDETVAEAEDKTTKS